MTREEFDVKIINFMARFRLADPYLVGSAARARLKMGDASLDKLEDIYVLIPFRHKSRLTKILEDFPDKTKTGWGDASIFFQDIKWDLICKDVDRYLSRVPTAFDGVAIHLSSNAVLMTAECASGKNSIIRSRPINRPNYKPYYEEHLRKQGLLKVTDANA